MRIIFTLIVVLSIQVSLFAQSQRLVLTEEFTNVNSGPDAAANVGYNNLLNVNAGKIVAIKYHTNFPNADPMNLHNPSPVQTRGTFYGLSFVPFAPLDGDTGIVNGGHANYTTQAKIDQAYAVPSPFDVNVNYFFSANFDTVFTRVVVRATQSFSGNIKLHVAIIEKNIHYANAPGTNGEKDFPNVMKAMLPSAAGTTLPPSFASGDSVVINGGWAISNVFSLSNLCVVAFVQDPSSKTVHQAGYKAPSALALDAGITNISNVPNLVCAPNISPVIVIKNFGNNVLTSATINYKVDNDSVQMQNWTGSLNLGETDTISLPSVNAIVGPGQHYFHCLITNPNSASDQDTLNNHLSAPFIGNNSASALPLNQDFESSTFPPNGWGINNPEADGTWTRSAAAGGNGTSTASAFFDNYNTNATGRVDEIMAPGFDAAAYDSVKLTFNVAYARYDATNSDTLNILASSDCGNTWTMVYTKGGTTLATAADAANVFVPGAGQWRNENIDLSAFAHASNVLLKFQNKGYYGNSLYLDDINITGVTAPSSSITVTSPNGGEFWAENSSQNITWTHSQGDTVNVYYSSNGGTSWTSIGMGSGGSKQWTVPATTGGNYLVKVQDIFNAAIFDVSDTVFTVISSSSFAVNANATNVTCNGACNGMATANASGGISPYTYSWSSGQTTQTITGLCAGVYTVTATDAQSATAQYTVIITQPSPLAAAISGAGSVCIGSSVMLTANGTGGTMPYNYNWSPVPDSLQNTTVSPSTSTMYYVTVTDANGCSANANHNVGVNILPTITAFPSVNTICVGSGETVTLTATGALTYDWSSGSSGSVVNVNPVTTTNYSVIGTDANGCADTAFVTVNVNMIQSLFQGDVFFKNNGTPVNVNSGKVYIYNVDSVGWIGAGDSANIISGGSFDMGSVPYGNYKIYITPDKIAYPFLANTYYDLLYTWDAASIVQFTCSDTTYKSIELDSISPLTGGFTVGGVIRADSSFTGKVTVQGDPVPGVDVALEQNPGSVMLATTTTDANGQFTFANIPLTPTGYYYTILANIPGFGLDSSYNIVVTGNEDNYDYFVSDSTIYIDSVMAATFNSVKHVDKVNENTDFKAYPNPYKNGTTISFELKERSNVSLEIYNALGERVAVLENIVKEAGVYRYIYSAKNLGSSNGIYFAKLKVNNSLSVAKLIEIE